jgi:hypothetical protein
MKIILKIDFTDIVDFAYAPIKPVAGTGSTTGEGGRPMSEFRLDGGCHCGAVRYVLTEPAISVQHCHCERCRKGTGAMTGIGAVIDRSALTISGSENLTEYRSSPSYSDHFCKICGSHLFFYEDSETRLMYFSPATLDEGAHPGHSPDKESHIYMRSKPAWHRSTDDLPKYQTTSPDEIITGAQKEEILNRDL